MALFLEILDGELKGTRTPVREGLVIGRRQGLLTIKDSKLSSKHAQVELRGDDQLWLVDLGSSNGIKVGTQRLREILLVDGVAFILGRTPFSVLAVEDLSGADIATVIGPAPVERTIWDDLHDLSERAAAIPAPASPELRPFSPILHLRFVRGLQTGTEWIVGYGPREVGSGSVDLYLEGLAIPARCFQLIPQLDGAILKRISEKEVRVNGSPIQQVMLKEGDVIEIMQTRIEVTFDENTDHAGGSSEVENSPDAN